MTLTDLLSHVGITIEDDDPKPKKATATPTQDPTAAAPPVATYRPPVSGSVAAAGIVVDRDSEMYKKLLAKTDFTTTPVYITLHTYIEPLQEMGFDEKTKFRTALKLAQTHEKGFTPDSLLIVFDSLKATLQTESDKFSQMVTSTLDKEVTQPQAQIQQLTQQLNDIQTQIKNLNERAFQASQKIDAAKHAFQLAFDGRMAELDNDKNSYASLLQ